jgi:uncharacterized membrane protein YtjA (UPF0391 family)
MGKRLAIMAFRLRYLEVKSMLRWTLVFLLVALVAGALGFYGLEGTAMWIAKVLFLVFLILFIITLVMGRRGPRL